MCVIVFYKSTTFEYVPFISQGLSFMPNNHMILLVLVLVHMHFYAFMVRPAQHYHQDGAIVFDPHILYFLYILYVINLRGYTVPFNSTLLF